MELYLHLSLIASNNIVQRTIKRIYFRERGCVTESLENPPEHSLQH
jgi:hypothetical protein